MSCEMVASEMEVEFKDGKCKHGFEAHGMRARGRDQDGNSLSAIKAAYTEENCDSFARVLKAGAIRTVKLRIER